MHEHEPVLFAVSVREPRRLFQRLAFEDDVRTPALGVLRFHRRRSFRHHDGRRNAQAPRMIGNALRMITGRHRDDAALALGFGKRRETHESAALLVRRRELQIFELEPDLRIEVTPKREAPVARGPHHSAFDDLGRTPDVVHRDESGRIRTLRHMSLP
jgi:hypothetical protein